MNVLFDKDNIYFCASPIKPLKTAVHLSVKTELSADTFSKGALDEYNMKLISDIRELFETAHSSIKSVAKSCNTRSSIKNGYPGLKKGVAGSRILEFSQIGVNKEDISVNLRLDHGKTRKTVIIIGDEQFVINPKGQIEKNPTMKFIRGKNDRPKGDTIQYYSQEEIDKLGNEQQFYALKTALQKYIDYINSRANEIFQIREKKADNIPGVLDDYSELIASVTDKFKYFKSSINKLSYNALDKDIFRIVNKIKTFHSQNSVLLKNASPDGRSLFLGYSKINKKPAMKIYLMDYGNKKVDKSYLIYDNKLAKFEPKFTNDRPNHYDYDFHYYTQDDINKSGLRDYLEVIDKKLDEVTGNLAHGIEERKSKTI